MRKTLLIIYCLLLTSCGGEGGSESTEKKSSGPINEITGDSDGRVEVAEIIRRSSDGGFSKCLGRLEEKYAGNVSEISCFEMSIIDTAGLHYFSNLTSLHLNGNKITSIDVSKNIRLETLSLISNDLESVDLSQNKKLKYLYLSNNELRGVEVSHLTDLVSLSANTNKLSYLDISKNNKLAIFEVVGNNLSYLDIENLPNLIRFYIGDNLFKHVDFNRTSAKIWDLDISENQIEELDLSNQDQLKYVTAFDNKIKRLIGVSENHKIMNHINLMNNQLNDIPVGLFDLPNKNAFIQLSKNPLSVNAIAELNELSKTFSELRFND